MSLKIYRNTNLYGQKSTKIFVGYLKAILKVNNFNNFSEILRALNISEEIFFSAIYCSNTITVTVKYVLLTIFYLILK